MRTPRLVILSFTSAVFVFFFLRFVSSASSPAPVVKQPAATTQKSALRSLISFSTPFSLFPPNAAITLTDDNSTFFPARPAAFGPALPAKGLSGQLWIGKGFPGIQAGEEEGELGCNDLPGFDGVSTARLVHKTTPLLSDDGKIQVWEVDEVQVGHASLSDKRTTASDKEAVPKTKKPVNKDDGTDDYLHEAVAAARAGNDGKTAMDHADIQSMQESAEIQGKVVLLSRGGCGFLEKVKWAQRRGATAVIVGDNQRGGPLIQMFARGDTSNVTIPAIFTSRTTAHLLSSLMHPGSFIEDILDDKGKPAMHVGFRGDDKTQTVTATTTSTAIASQPTVMPGQAVKKDTAKRTEGSRFSASQPGWISRMLHLGKASKAPKTSKESSASRQKEWIMVEDWSDEKDREMQTKLKQSKDKVVDPVYGVQVPAEDGFKIGVQDWRDPSLAATANKDQEKAGVAGKSKQDDATAAKSPTRTSKDQKSDEKKGKAPKKPSRLMHKLFGDGLSTETVEAEAVPQPADTPLPPANAATDGPHEGLWVTITPTASGSPIFDTLMVIVVSPLITLSVVYALLIIRAKIRRRRWRAPKSVVDRLPVRTYHTVASTPSRTSRVPSRVPSPKPSTPTTPLLASATRPRSRTSSGVPQVDDLLRPDAPLPLIPSRGPSRANSRASSRTRPEHEKAAASQWKKYMGRQVECVVCLEEYIDGISRVMSLPCGHEFHAECITPWLTTRRRTCPICKGDVVRSLARGSPSSPRWEAYSDTVLANPLEQDDDDTDSVDERNDPSSSSYEPYSRVADAYSEVVTQATRSGSSRAQEANVTPPPRSPRILDREDEDLERGRPAVTFRRVRRPSQMTWLESIATSLGIGPDTPPAASRSTGLSEDGHTR